MNKLVIVLLSFFSVGICSAGTFSITPQINFGSVTIGSNVQPEVTIKNTGIDILQIGNIGNINPASSPFTVINVSCANSIIQPGGQCSLIVLFSPDSVGVISDSFNIEVLSDGSNFDVSLFGEGGPAIDEPDILVSFSSVNFGVIDVLDIGITTPYTLYQRVDNKGRLDLNVSSIDVIGKDAAEVNVIENCVGAGPILTNSFCAMSIELKPLTPGDKYAEVVITSNDPDENPFIIPVIASAFGEDDGVSAVIEDAGPNGGDGNNDDVLDSKQSNVTTLVDGQGNYVTYLADSSLRFKNMSILQVGEPTDFVVGSGIFDFAIEGVGSQSIEVGIILPAGLVPGAYYVFDSTPDNPVKHWFNFAFNGETGAFILGNATFSTSSGDKFQRSVLRLILKDGGPGDTDHKVNGVITMTSAMSLNLDSDSDAASFDLFQILFALFILGLARKVEWVQLYSSEH